MIPLCKPFISNKSIQNLMTCLKSGWIGYGPICHALEQKFTEASGWALATSTCTSALFLAAKLCWESYDDEIICPAITFVSTPMAFLNAGWKIRLADVDPKTLLITRNTIEKSINEKTKAVVVVHLYGQKANIDEIKKLCEEKNLILIEDCAHRLDLFEGENRVSDYACYSFNAVKEIPSGEGGLLWCKHSDKRKTALAISNVGLGIDTWERSSTLSHNNYSFTEEIGLKLRLNDILASLVYSSLDQFHQNKQTRERIFKKYNHSFSELYPFIDPIPRNLEDSFLMYVVKTNNLDVKKFRESLAKQGVASSLHYPSLTEHVLFKNQGKFCPTSNKFSKRIVTLPCFVTLSRKNQKKIIESVKEAVYEQLN